MSPTRGVHQRTGTPRGSGSSRTSWTAWRGSARRYAWRVPVVVLLVAFPASVPALAAGSYAVRVSASSPAAAGHPFRVTASGVAHPRALLYVYVGRQPCFANWNTNGRIGVYQPGHSYFLPPDLGKKPFSYAWVSGSFRNSFTAHAGSPVRREYACAYLETPNQFGGYRVTAAHASFRYTVKK